MNKNKKTKTAKQKAFDWAEAILFALVAIFLIKSFFMQSYMVFSGSMENTLLVNDLVFVNRLQYSSNIPFTSEEIIRYSDPKRGEIIVFKFPIDGRPFVKRCVGLPGDTIEVKHKTLYINGRKYNEPFAIHRDKREFPSLQEIYPYDISREEYQKLWESGEFYNNRYISASARDNFGPVVVPEEHYFMMGDNRDNSDDSRFWGPLDREYILGTPMIYYFSFDKSEPIWKIWEFIRWERILRPVKWKTYSY
ncbi:MAG: signal peptidase I [candidate division WOR-3 bacterium]|nr:signal peptidase I [candidate division WOR-3 bacterium]